jgi:hypothetical protein
MNRYLKDALCLLDKGHKWYVGLAEQYELGDAKKYIEGFYATVHGTVELKTSKGRKPARGATVTIRDPHDGTIWKAVTNNQGQYEISKVILHDRCSPFDIAAEWKGSRSEKTYTGPLEKPDPGRRHKVDLLLEPSISGKIRFEHTISAKTKGLFGHGNSGHTVPFFIDFSTDPPTIQGEGTCRSPITWQSGALTGGVSVKGSEEPPGNRVWVSLTDGRISRDPGQNAQFSYIFARDGFRSTETTTDRKVLHGELLQTPSGEARLRLLFDLYSTGCTTPSTNGPYIVPLIDGWRKEFPVRITVGEIVCESVSTITLHLDKKERSSYVGSVGTKSRRPPAP